MIQHCHDLGVMHRDLKPENFLLIRPGDVSDIKATDFGLSTFFKAGDRFKELVGSPYYVAPEVLRRGYSYQADYWSLGVILYILLCGLPPFWGDNDTAIFKMILQGDIDFDTQPWPKISEDAKDLIRKLLTVDPSKRISVQQVLEHKWMQGNVSDTQLDHVVVKRMKKFAAMNKLKKTAMMMIGQKLSPEEIEGMKKLFQSIDKDNSGTISLKELQEAMDQWGQTISTTDLLEVMKSADVDGDGQIDYNEFVAATMNISKLEKDELIQKTFMEMDKDGNGTLTVNEIKDALAKFGLTEDIEEIIKQADTDNDGQINYREFQAMMRDTIGTEDSDLPSLRNLNLGCGRR